MPNLSQHRQSAPLLALGQVIRGERLTLGLSQEELAHRAELDLSYVGRVERGDNNASILAFLKLAKALNLSGAELMERANL